MYLSIEDTNDLTALDLAVLRTILDDGAKGGIPRPEPAKAEPTPEPAKAEPAKPKAKAKPAAKETQAAAEDFADEAPTPAAPEAPAPAEEDEGPSREDAVALATKMISNGKAPAVKEALSGLGVARVGELSDEQVAEFIKALSN